MAKDSSTRQDRTAASPARPCFRPEFLDFERGIRVGHLEPQERVTQLLKARLQKGYGQPFIIDRWGRGVYWQWICFLPKANRLAKPASNNMNFGCAKYFISIEREDKLFKAGMQIERGLTAGKEGPFLADDWDWHRLLGAVRGDRGFWRLLRRLVSEEGFEVFAGSWPDGATFTRRNMPAPAGLLSVLQEARPDTWAGFQVYYPMTPEEVRQSSGADLVDAMAAVFDELAPLMNACMDITIRRIGSDRDNC
jgi:hypothetical protein